MKKKLVSMLALALSVCTLASCGGNGGNSSSGGGNTPLTQDQIYAKVMEAADATSKYAGAYTISATQKNEQLYGDAVFASETTLKVSMDVAAKQLFMQQGLKRSNQLGEGEAQVYQREMISKLFKEGDKYYTYNKQTYGETSQEQYAIASDAMIQMEQNLYSLATLCGSMLEETAKVSGTVEATNAAYAAVFADSKAAIAAASTDEDSEWYGVSADGSAVISCADNNGEYSVSMTLNINMTMDDEAYETVSEIKLVAKDGKLTSISMKENSKETKTESDAGENPVEEVDIDNSETTYSISYAFAKADYDAITTQLPADVKDDGQDNTYYGKGINVVLNGVDCGENYGSGSTVEEALKDITKGTWGYSNMSIVWYTDAACTKPLDPATVTAAEFEAMDTLYGKATADAGYALVASTEVDVFAADVPDVYKMVFVDMDLLDLEADSSLESRSVGETIYVDEDPSVTTYVNGQAITANLTIEEGKTYEVKYVSTYAKADLNIFKFLG